eukprot:CAMPEP_0194484888 /NCGR_PEP_ID=MMETSP0253-20130528/6072_1 /TAXON_ID=2966 /ORGANISM="Noctiluca scintillans" /LENGTH=73 /DNA_ID=CAMNT_0039324767 /DNA_START=100 /DNA_END=319 /DNA_ORIENTATION=-
MTPLCGRVREQVLENVYHTSTCPRSTNDRRRDRRKKCRVADSRSGRVMWETPTNQMQTPDEKQQIVDVRRDAD